MSDLTQAKLDRERIANRPKHWVRLVTACNNRCLFCLDMDTPRNVYLSEEEIQAELRRGREEKGADKVILSGGEASLHPLFPDLIRYAHDIGYTRVQTVTNGLRYADRAFFDAVIEAGLDEITFSLHGHTAELHDHLVQTPGSYRKLMKGLLRALRDGRPIVNVDIVINQQNVAHVADIVGLCAKLGVREFDLLHVIPQAAAFRNRDQVFYDVREHLPQLQRVFALNREGFYIWTNRFPVSYLEGLEDLIQDPHKLLDEVHGRRYPIRRYLDHGTPLECRDPERCPHCFIEPFCDTMDDVVEGLHQGTHSVWEADRVPGELPFGCTRLGWSCDTPLEIPELTPGVGLRLRLSQPAAIPWTLPDPTTLVLATPAGLEAALAAPVPPWVELEIALTQATAAWLLAHRERIAPVLDQVRIDQPTHERLEQAVASDVREPRAFFRELDLRVRVSGLPACLAPDTRLVEAPRVLAAESFDGAGRLDIEGLARHHVARVYGARSIRCDECRVSERCDGLHINAVRDQGLGQLQPLRDGSWAEDAARQLEDRWPVPPARVRHGRPPQGAHPSLPGHPEPGPAPEDPLARKRGLRRSDFQVVS